MFPLRLFVPAFAVQDSHIGQVLLATLQRLIVLSPLLEHQTLAVAVVVVAVVVAVVDLVALLLELKYLHPKRHLTRVGCNCMQYFPQLTKVLTKLNLFAVWRNFGLPT